MPTQLNQEYLQKLQAMRLLDDDLMIKVFDNDPISTELILRIILNHDDLHVESVVSQREYKNVQGRSVRLDIFAKDSTGKVYDIEIQRADHGAGAKRARFNSSMIDTKLLDVGDNFEKLPESYVIFITENDVLGLGLPVYHIDRIIQESGVCFGDGSHIIYVNGAYQNNTTDIGKLMHDFRCSEANSMHFDTLAKRIKYFKEEGGVAEMCRIMEDVFNDGKFEQAKNTAINLIKLGTLSIAEIAAAVSLSVEEVRAIAETVEQ